MSSANRFTSRRRMAFGGATLAVLAGVAAIVAALASASSFTLRAEKNVHVNNTGAATKPFAVKPVDTHEAVAVGPSGFAVYTFQGETTHHLICHKSTSAAKNCWAFWPPVSPSSAHKLTKQSAIKGKLGTFHNHGMLQLTLNGHPLYYFTPDLQAHNKQQAMGDELNTFGSIWHIVRAGGGSQGTSGSQPMTTNPTTTTPYPTTPTTTTTPYTY